MMGLSEVARATQTPNLSIQYRHSPWLPPCHGVTLELGSERARPHVDPAIGLSLQGLGRRCCRGFGQTHYEPAASAQAPSTDQLLPHLSGVVAASLCSAWDPGAQSHIPRPVAALSQPFAVSTSGKAALYTPLPPARTPPLC
ncbi:hypothetical protein LTLLF_136365 [Microtus ochrogaster]|uniref:Uncharacterized protein n=1 Tax=Microtus ochrogaster TaxID=79684 RepID=A0A8J6GQX3_MICOH|nr:hypothetical protein LTLLF_136365 [Microtus ochrogaster]